MSAVEIARLRHLATRVEWQARDAEQGYRLATGCGFVDDMDYWAAVFVQRKTEARRLHRQADILEIKVTLDIEP